MVSCLEGTKNILGTVLLLELLLVTCFVIFEAPAAGDGYSLLKSGFLGFLIKSSNLFSDAFSDDCTAVAATFRSYLVNSFYDLFIFQERNCVFCHEYNIKSDSLL
jgi:hypothetical protein